MAKYLLLFFVSFSIITFTFAHGGEHEKKKKDKSVEKVERSSKDQDAEVKEHADDHEHNKKIMASLEDFPTLHPLIVHFPIVLLLVAALLQLISLFWPGRELSVIVLGTALAGFLGALLANYTFHPHVVELGEEATMVLTEHESFGAMTVQLSGLVVFLKGASHFFLKRRLVYEIIVALFIVGGAVIVSVAGHYGAQLVHLEGVGPQGKYLEVDPGHKH